MSAMPGPIPGSHTASHEPTRVCTLTIHDVTHLPLVRVREVGWVPSLHSFFCPFLLPPLQRRRGSSKPSPSAPVQIQQVLLARPLTSGGDRLPSNFFFFHRRVLRVRHLLQRRRTPARSIGTPAQRVELPHELPHRVLFTSRPLTSTSSLREAPSSLNAFPIENEHRATTRYFEKPSSSSGRRHWHPSLSFQATQDA